MRCSLYITQTGLVKCTCGTLIHFAEDLVESICPIIDTYLLAEFNGKKFLIDKTDNTSSIIRKWKNAKYSE